MKTVQFIYPHHTGGYGCSEPGNMGGEYVPKAVAEALLAACESGERALRTAFMGNLCNDDFAAVIDRLKAAIRGAESVGKADPCE